MTKNLHFILFLILSQSLSATNIVKICITTQLGESVDLVEFTTSGTNAVQIDNDVNGCYQFEVEETAGILSITPSKDFNLMNGVDVADLFAMRNHILAFSQISPFQVIASDVNASAAMMNNNTVAGGLTTLDMVLVGKGILQLDNSTFNNNASWIFADPNLASSNAVTLVPKIEIPTPLSSDIQIDLLGIKKADTNLSANTMLLNPPVVYDLTDQLILRTPEQTRSANENFEVAFTADNFNAMVGTQYTIQFNTDKLKLIDFEKNLEGYQTTIDTDWDDEGVFNSYWVSLNTEVVTLDATEELFKLTFRAKADIVLSEVISINSFSTLDVAYNANQESMEVVLLFDEATANENLENPIVNFKQNYPNPFQTSTQFNVTLNESNFIKLEITDAMGRVVETLINDWQSSGEHQFSFAPSNLSSGIYFGKFTIGDETLVQKLIYMP